MRYTKILFSLCIGVAAMTACTDAWDDHYGPEDATNVGTATQNLWEIIKSDAELYDLARVLQATGFNRDLSSGQMLTIWAPRISADKADSLINQYMAEKAAGIKEEDNTALVQFVKNHVCMYNRTVSTITENDTVKMLNGKYKTLSYNTLDGKEMTVKNQLATNGVFYKIDESLPFFGNVYERLFENKKLGKFAEFLKSYNEYTLNEKKSVPGEIKDGEVVYLDSVMELSNIFMTSFGSLIMREDSNFIMLAPTDEVWEAQYNRYSQYFVFPPTVNKRDSLQRVATHAAIFRDRTFSANPDVNPEMGKKDKMSRDSIMSTAYSKYDWENGVFYNPYRADGIFGGKDSIECSNGMIYIDDVDGTIDPKHSFMPNDIWSAANGSMWIYGADDESPAKRNDREEQKQYVATTVAVKTTDSLEVNGQNELFHMYGDRYILFSGIANNSTTTQFSYSLPALLSNVYYNVYFVFVPAVAENDPYLQEDRGLAVKFRAYLHEMREDGKLTTGTGASNRIVDTETGERDLSTKAGIIDTLCLLKAHQFKYTTRGGDEVAWIDITSYVSNGENMKTHTRRIRLNGIILRPFETQAEAEEDYAKYLNARNQK